MSEALHAVNSMSATAGLAAVEGRFGEIAPSLRQAISAVPAVERRDIVLPLVVWEPLVAPVVERLGEAGVVAWFASRECADPAAALADFWVACAAGEVGFDD